MTDSLIRKTQESPLRCRSPVQPDSDGFALALKINTVTIDCSAGSHLIIYDGTTVEDPVLFDFCAQNPSQKTIEATSVFESTSSALVSFEAISESEEFEIETLTVPSFTCGEDSLVESGFVLSAPDSPDIPDGVQFCRWKVGLAENLIRSESVIRLEMEIASINLDCDSDERLEIFSGDGNPFDGDKIYDSCDSSLNDSSTLFLSQDSAFTVISRRMFADSNFEIDVAIQPRNCGFDVDGTGETINSPLYSAEPYGPNLRCFWNLTVPDTAQGIQFELLDFQVRR